MNAKPSFKSIGQDGVLAVRILCMNTLNPKEIDHFSKDSKKWWEEGGPFAPLHRLNPVRMRHIRQQVGAHFGLDDHSLKPFTDLSILDAGCGGGLVCEPLTRLGGTVTGIDADSNAIAAAKAHAAQSALAIDYRVATTDDTRGQYDVVLALEIVEHVADVDLFVSQCVNLCRPGGLVIFSTLNRTAKSFALGIVAAEYILQWVPRGTHNWRKFLRPSELSRLLREKGAAVRDVTGLVFNPFTGEFGLSASDIDINYFIVAEKPAA